MARSIISFFVLALFLAACNSEEQHPVLSKPPYQPLSDSIAETPDRADLYYRRGTLLYRENELKLAEADVRKAWELDPRPEYALDLVTVLKQQGQDEAAVKFLEQASAKFNESLHLKVALAQGYQKQNQDTKALTIINEILKKYPNNIDALLMQADLLSSDNEAGASLAVLEKAYAMAPGDEELAQRLAFAYAEAKNPLALTLSDSMLRADPEGRRAEPHYFKGVYYANLGQLNEAVQQFDLAIRADYNFLDAHINKGIAYYDAGQWKDATAAFTQAQRISPDEADPYYWLAKTQEKEGKREEAKLNYQRAYGLDKTLVEAKQAAERM